MATPEQLIAVLLSDTQDQFARDIPAKLGISQPSFSRLVKQTKNAIPYGAKLGKRYTVRDAKYWLEEFPIYRVDAEGKVLPLGSLTPVRHGRFVFEPMHGSNTIFDGIPWFLDCLRPQGFLGRRFPQQNPSLGLPESVNDWTDSDVLKALYYRGEDLPGNLMVGPESVARYLQARNPRVAQRSEYPELAAQALAGETPASSAGGEQPKFTCFNGEKHLIVKFSPVINESRIYQRWGDLLVCEDIANKVLSASGVPSAKTTLISEQGRYFLESERFDRTANGRLPLLPLGTIDSEFVGCGSGWGRSVTALHENKRVSGETLKTVLLLEMFGRMIGNSDMHLGNISFFTDDVFDAFSLAPIYDMVPMFFAPSSQGEIAEKALKLPTPLPDNVETWSSAVVLARQFWETVTSNDLVSSDFREIAKRCLVSIHEATVLSALVRSV